MKIPKTDSNTKSVRLKHDSNIFENLGWGRFKGDKNNYHTLFEKKERVGEDGLANKDVSLDDLMGEEN